MFFAISSFACFSAVPSTFNAEFTSVTPLFNIDCELLIASAG